MLWYIFQILTVTLRILLRENLEIKTNKKKNKESI